MTDPGIIPLHSAETLSWQEQLQQALRTADELARALQIPRDALPHDPEAAGDFPFLVPAAFVARMEKGNVDDPLLRQVLAVGDETRRIPGFDNDPVGELSRYADQPGLIRKYRGRALLVATGHCAINCRYCFRRHYPYAEHAQSTQERLDQIDELLLDDGLQELILSGGDPLLLPDGQLAAIVDRLAQHTANVTLRIHTRLPIVIPDRVTRKLIEALSKARGEVVVVVHSNHPREIDEATGEALRRLREAGVTVLNQAVLLAGVNDSADTLATLSDRLFAAGALPYYLHQLDPVAGAAHFAVEDSRAREIIGRLAGLRPGYLVPRLMREVPGAASKRELAPIYED